MGKRNKIEQAIFILNTHAVETQNAACRLFDARSLLVTTVIYLVLLLSLPLSKLTNIILFGIYPIIASALLQVSFGRLFLQSLIIVPFIILVGIFNPIYDCTPVFRVGTITVTSGWITFLSLTIRGMFAFQSVLLLIKQCGFFGICQALRKMGCPAFLTTQLLMVYRYLTVLLQEALVMKRAREARCYGKQSFSMKMWGELVGQLFIRTLDRSEKIYSAMLSRGYSGSIPTFSSNTRNLKVSDILYITIWSAVFIVLRFVPFQFIFSF